MVADEAPTEAVPTPYAEPVEPPAVAAVPVHVPVPIPDIVDVHALDWAAVQGAMDGRAIRGRMRNVVEALENLLDSSAGANLMFDEDREGPEDRAIQVSPSAADRPLWIIGDLHGDLPALESALACVRQQPRQEGEPPPGIIFLGDFFDDEGLGLEVVLRVFELVLQSPGDVCIVAGNHDEALAYDGARFSSSVAPSDFADFLNANLAHEWIGRAGKLVVRMIARAPRALFLPDGLLIAHGGFPLSDVHARLAETGDWNDATCLSDFTWARAHPKARRKMPNRFSRGSQFGWEDFADFCALAQRLGRPVTHMVRGHDHVDERWAIPPAYAAAFPLLTTVALSRRLGREQYGPHERVPTMAKVVTGSLPQVHRLHIPAGIIQDVFPPAPAAPSPLAEAQ